MIIAFTLFLIIAGFNWQNDFQQKITDSPILFKKITVPKKLRVQNDSLDFGGDIRIGDLTNNSQVDFIVYRGAEGDKQGATKPCFIGAFDMFGNILWQKGEGGIQPYRPGPVAIHDIDNDGQTEVVCFFYEDNKDADPFGLEGVTIQILDGKNGEIKKQSRPKIFDDYTGKGPNWVHQRIFIANFRGNKQPQDFIVKLGKHLVAFDHELNIIWTYFNPQDKYQECPAYIPSVGDIDGDGKDEVNGGYYLLDNDGSVMWEKKMGRNMDAVAITEWDNGNIRAFGSGFGHIVDKQGNIILKLGKEAVPHGQEMKIADFDVSKPGPEMIIRYNGHRSDAMLVSNNGEILKRFKLNESPNNTGMTTVYWFGEGENTLLFNGGVLWHGWGEKFADLPDLPPSVGEKKMGWYHCIPADVCSDKREEIITYNPWDKFIFIYTQNPYQKEQFSNYKATPRQYNVRLMD
jgi:hypothetical protein